MFPTSVKINHFSVTGNSGIYHRYFLANILYIHVWWYFFLFYVGRGWGWGGVLEMRQFPFDVEMFKIFWSCIMKQSITKKLKHSACLFVRERANSKHAKNIFLESYMKWFNFTHYHYSFKTMNIVSCFTYIAWSKVYCFRLYHCVLPVKYDHAAGKLSLTTSALENMRKLTLWYSLRVMISHHTILLWNIK